MYPIAIEVHLNYPVYSVSDMHLDYFKRLLLLATYKRDINNELHCLESLLYEP